MYKKESDFVPGRPGTEVFVPEHLLLPLSRDKGTPGQDFFLSWDKGTTGRPVPSLGNPSLHASGAGAS